MPIRQRLFTKAVEATKTAIAISIYGDMERRFPQQAPVGKNTSGIVYLRVKKPGQKKFNELQQFPYDNATREKRGKVLRDCFVRRDGWTSYHQFANAAFQIEEFERGYPSRVLAGAKK